MKSFVAQSGQSIFDLAYMAYGDSSAIFQLLVEKPTLSMNTPFAGKRINYSSPINVNHAKQQLTSLVIATSWQDNVNHDYILQEDGSDFILEDGSGKIELE